MRTTTRDDKVTAPEKTEKPSKNRAEIRREAKLSKRRSKRAKVIRNKVFYGEKMIVGSYKNFMNKTKRLGKKLKEKGTVRVTNAAYAKRLGLTRTLFMKQRRRGELKNVFA